MWECVFVSGWGGVHIQKYNLTHTKTQNSSMLFKTSTSFLFFEEGVVEWIVLLFFKLDFVLKFEFEDLREEGQVEGIFEEKEEEAEEEEERLEKEEESEEFLEVEGFWDLICCVCCCEKDNEEEDEGKEYWEEENEDFDFKEIEFIFSIQKNCIEFIACLKSPENESVLFGRGENVNGCEKIYRREWRK